MHEASLVRSLLSQVEQLLREHGATAVEEIRVEVGPLSNVEPPLLESAFAELAPRSSANGATLRIDEVPLTARCRDCQQEIVIADFVFQCSRCGSQSVDVVQGDHLRLIDVTLRQPETVEEGST